MNTNRLMRSVSIKLQQKPQAWAKICGSSDNPNLSGNVLFYQTPQGVLIAADIHGLPHSHEECSDRFFGFHIHSGTDCSDSSGHHFSNTLGHDNPDNCLHPHHAGDLPPLLGSLGNAFQVVLTNRFHIHEIIGKTVIIHDRPDDFTTQPSGNSGTKIACGEIRSCGR